MAPKLCWPGAGVDEVEVVGVDQEKAGADGLAACGATGEVIPGEVSESHPASMG